MATFDYATLQGDATDLITEFGQTAAIRRVTNGGDAWNPTQTTADTACTVVVTDYANSEKDGTRIQVTDRRILMAVGSITPTPADRFVLSSTVHDIIAVKPLNPGGTTLLFELQVRF